jgi:flagellar biosynthesis/type III secretory pathway protein FliH
VEDNRASAMAEKQAAMISMADTIEAELASALAEVSHQTDAMAATADAMIASATRNGFCAQGAAAAAAQTLANAQAVARATEQLTASIHNISQQMSCYDDVGQPCRTVDLDATWSCQRWCAGPIRNRFAAAA